MIVKRRSKDLRIKRENIHSKFKSTIVQIGDLTGGPLQRAGLDTMEKKITIGSVNST